jgi:hypothetical protein
MSIPKRKTDINVYGEKEFLLGEDVTARRKALLEEITKSDTYLPDSILHDDLDLGMLNYIKENFQITSDGYTIPIIPKILTIQRWAELENTWEYVDNDNNIKLPYIAVIRKPDVQPGTNPITQRTIPERASFYYTSVPTWNGTQFGADVYKIPSPIAMDISFDVVIVCNKITDLNKFNQRVLQKFTSRQSYTQVKGHFIPIILDSINDDSTINSVDTRRFYVQTYKFTMLGFIIDSNEFIVKPALNRFFLLTEFVKEGIPRKKYLNKNVDITIMSFKANGTQTMYSVGESIGILFNVSINGLLQERDVDFYHISYTSKITFVSPPPVGSTVTISYYKGKNNVLLDTYGKVLLVSTEYFEYDGSSLIFTLTNSMNSIVSVDINGLQEERHEGYDIESRNQIRLLGAPYVGSRIGVKYLY